MRRKRRAMGCKCIAADAPVVRQKKQSFAYRLQGFPGQLSLGSRNLAPEWLCADSEHANDSAPAPIRELGRIFRHAQQSDTERFASKVSQNRARVENRDGTANRRYAFGRRNLSAISGRP